MKLKKMFRAMSASAVKLDVEKRTAEFSFSSEYPVERWFGKEILKHSPDAADMSRLNDGGALLWNHNSDVQIGVVERAMIEGGKGVCAVRFSKNQKAEEVMQDIADNICRNVSFGYQVNEMVRDNPGSTDEPQYTATKWMPYEISFAPVPADPTVGIGRSDEGIEREVKILGETESRSLQPKTGVVKMELTEEQKKAAADQREADRKEAVTAERSRISAIEALGKRLGQSDLARQLVDGGKSIEEARSAFLEKVGQSQTPVNGNEAIVGLTDREISKFSFLRAMHAMANPTDRAAQEAAKFEREVSEAAIKKTGKAARGFLIPVDVLRAENRRDLTVGSATAGGDLVATNLLSGSFIELLRKKMVLSRLGAQSLNGLVGNIAIPKMTGAATAYWVGENTAPTEGAQTVGQVAMSPKSLAAFTDISRKLLLQSSIDVENMVKQDLATIVALEVDRVGLYGSGSGSQPSGLRLASGLNTTDFAGSDPTFAEIVDMEAQVAADNADVGTMAYAVNALGRGKLKVTEKSASGTTGNFIWERDNTVNGYRAEVSNQIDKLSTADQDYWFGNWNDLILGFWSGLDLLVDPYTGSSAGTVRVVAFQDMDVAVRHGESFCYGNKTIV
jgi:HK97 family phage major capsid protein